MDKNYTHIDDLLGKSLAKETTTDEELVIQNWLKESPDNEQYFKEFQWLWAKMQEVKPFKRVDTEGALGKLHARMEVTPTLKAVKTPNKIFNLSFIMKVAAVFFIGFAIYSQFTKPEKPIIIQATLTAKTDTLMDGSIITLNKKSGLTLSDRFNKKERRMKLTGEAYFEVAHDATRPFVVEIQDLEVVAVGTAFNIDNVADNRRVSIMVTDGKVKVANKTETEYAMKGETAVYDMQTGHISIEKREDANKLAYKTRHLRFDETPLSMAVAQLSQVYGVNIILKNKQLENCPLVVTFDNKPLEDVLMILEKTFSIVVEKSGETIVLTGGNCGND